MNPAKTLLEQKFKTNPTYLYDILHDFLLHYPKRETVLWDLEIDKEDVDNHGVQLQLMLRRFQGYGWIGSVICEPINEGDVLVRIYLCPSGKGWQVYDPKTKKWKNDEDRIYTEAQKFLQAFSQHIQKLFSEELWAKPEKPNDAPAAIISTIDQDGKYDELCMRWVKRPISPYQNRDEFLSEHAPEVLSRTFTRILADACRRGVIDKEPGKGGRYIPCP